MAAKTVLIVGQDPDTVDYSDPAIPPGMDAAKVRAGLAAAARSLTEAGYDVTQCYTDLGETAEAVLTAQLKSAPYDCVVVGAGVRLPPSKLHLFETIVNTIHRHAPQARIAFNTRPDDTAEAARRWLA